MCFRSEVGIHRATQGQFELLEGETIPIRVMITTLQDFQRVVIGGRPPGRHQEIAGNINQAQCSSTTELSREQRRLGGLRLGRAQPLHSLIQGRCWRLTGLGSARLGLQHLQAALQVFELLLPLRLVTAQPFHLLLQGFYLGIPILCPPGITLRTMR